MAKLSLNFMSDTLRRAVPLDVFVPTDHMMLTTAPLPTANKPMKTLYYLEGLMGNHSGPGNYSRIQGFAEDYNLCVVVIGGENKWYSNSSLSGDRFIDYICKDVVNFTRKTFNLSTAREDTYIGGFSMGGHGAMLLGLSHPEIFGRIVSLSAALHHDVYLTATNPPTWDLTSKQEYETMLGVRDINDYPGTENDYTYYAELTARNPLKPQIFMCCGQLDSLHDLDATFRDHLRSLGYDVAWTDYEGVGHSYYASDLGIEDAFKWLGLENFVENYPYMTIKANCGVHNLAPWTTWYNYETVQES